MFVGLKQIFNSKSLLIPIYCHVFVKSALPIQRNLHPFMHLLRYTVRAMTSLLLCTVVMLLLPIFALLHDIIYFALNYYHGKAFCGTLTGMNAILHKNDSVINAILPAEVEDASIAIKLYNHFRDEICPMLLSKQHHMNCTIEHFLWYPYYKKLDFVDLTKVIKVFDDYEDYDDFQAKMQEIGGTPMPYGGKFTWELLIGTKLMIWPNGKRVLPIILRHNHALADGMALMTLTIVNYYQDGVRVVKEKMDRLKVLMSNATLKRKRAADKSIDYVATAKQAIRVLTQDYAIVHNVGRETKNSLHPRHLSGEKYLCWCLEQDADEYKAKIKAIRDCIVGVSYTDVLLTAATAMLQEYFQKANTSPPESLTVYLPYYLASTDFNKAVQLDKNKVPTVKLANEFTSLCISLPINKHEIKDDLRKILDFINRQTTNLKMSMDIFMSSWLSSLGGIVPPQVCIGILQRWFEATLVISNLPGNPLLNYKTGHPLTDSVFFTNNFANAGVSILLSAYNEQIRIGCFVDKACVSDKEAGQILADGIFKYINVMAKEFSTSPK